MSDRGAQGVVPMLALVLGLTVPNGIHANRNNQPGLKRPRTRYLVIIYAA
jgi:hypothetical protein